MHREQAIEYLRRHDAGVWYGELKANRRSLQTGDQEKEQAARDVHDAEAFVIDGDDPFVKLAENGQRLRIVLGAKSYFVVDASRHFYVTRSAQRDQVGDEVVEVLLAEIHRRH